MTTDWIHVTAVEELAGKTWQNRAMVRIDDIANVQEADSLCWITLKSGGRLLVKESYDAVCALIAKTTDAD